jgi:RNA polymerase sigma-70 factor (ECF subfamily)
MAAGDDEAVRAVLHPHVELVIDSGDDRPEPAATPGADGREAAVTALRALAASDITILMASVNGLPGLLLARGDEIVAVLTADVRDGLLSNVWVGCNPDKLRHWNG